MFRVASFVSAGHLPQVNTTSRLTPVNSTCVPLWNHQPASVIAPWIGAEEIEYRLVMTPKQRPLLLPASRLLQMKYCERKNKICPCGEQYMQVADSAFPKDEPCSAATTTTLAQTSSNSTGRVDSAAIMFFGIMFGVLIFGSMMA